MLELLNQTPPIWLPNLALLVVKTSVIALVGFLLLTLMQQRSASQRYHVLLLAMLAILLLPLLSLALPAWQALPAFVQASPAHAQRARPEAELLAERGLQTAPAARAMPVVRSRTTSATKDQPMARSIFGWMLIAWLVGALAVALRTGIKLRHVRVLQRQAVPAADPVWQSLVDEAAAAFGVTGVPRVKIHPEPIMPMLAGWLRPTILIPAEAEAWSIDRRRDVVRHEMAHLHRGDLLLELVSLITCAAHWFNPLIWRAHRQLIIERERACDDLALSAGSKPSNYADHLLQTAVQFRQSVAVLPGMARPSDLETRLTSVLDRDCSRQRMSTTGQVFVALIAFVLLIPIASLAFTIGGERREVPYNGAEVERLRNGLDALDPQRQAEIYAELAELGPGHPLERALSATLFREFGSDSRLFDLYGGLDEDGDRLVGPDEALAALNHGFAVRRAAAAQALGNFHNAEITDALSGAVFDDNWHVREWAVRSLGNFRRRAAVPALSAAITDESAVVREWSARGLGHIGDAAGLPALAEAMSDPSPDVRAWSARAMAHIGDPRAIGALAAGLSDSDADVREWSVRALGEIGDRRAAPALIDALNDEDPEVRQWAVRALNSLADDPAATPVPHYAERPETGER